MKVKKIILSLLIIILCFATLTFAACGDNKVDEEKQLQIEMQNLKDGFIKDLTAYPSTLDNPQLMSIFYKDIIDDFITKIDAATTMEQLRDIQYDISVFMRSNGNYINDRLSFELRQDTLGMCYISGTYEDKPYYVHWYLGGALSAPAFAQKTTVYYAEDPELAIKEMVITNNDVSGSEDFQPMTRLGNSGYQYVFTKNTTHYAFIITKGKEVVGIHLQTMFLFFGPEENLNKTNKFLASGIFETPMTEDQVKNYIQTIIDGKAPSQNNKLIPNNAAYIYYMDVCMQFYAVSQNDIQRIAFNPEDIGDPVTINSVYSDTAFTTDENGAPVNQITLENGDTVEIRADFPGDEYIIVTTSCDIDYNYTGTTNRTFIFQMQPLDKNIYSGSGRQLNLIASCDIHFRLPFVEKTEHDTTFALAVGKYLVNQLKSGVSPENLTIG